MECEKYKVIISEKAKNMLASNIAFIAKASADAATKAQEISKPKKMSFIIAMIGQTQQNVNLAIVKFLINGQIQTIKI